MPINWTHKKAAIATENVMAKRLILCGLNDLANEAVIAASKVSDFVLLRKVECQGGVRKMPSFHQMAKSPPLLGPMR